MPFVQSDHLQWHEGEKTLQTVLSVPPIDNPIAPFLTPCAAHQLQTAPLLAIGTLDSLHRPWTTIWGGEPGFARSLGSSVFGIKTIVDPNYDPVIETLLGGRPAEEVVQEEGAGRVVSGLAIDLDKRSRVKLSGRMVAGALGQHRSDFQDGGSGVAEVQLVIKVEQSLGNCPKYLNKKQISPSLPQPRLLSDSLPLSEEAIKLLATADLFFVSSSNHHTNMGTNYRGGSPGFVRLAANSDSGVVLAYPEYSGNRYYQTLGNLHTTPSAGFVFPDFDTGDVLYLTARTETLIGKEAAALLPRSNLVVKIHVVGARFVQNGLPFRGEVGERSPYNPPIRHLASEQGASKSQSGNDDNMPSATLVKKEILSSTVARFRFSFSNPAGPIGWTPGQYVALSFERELGMGYSHMRDDDPKSLNDDYIRTFTVSSALEDVPHNHFEITVRSIGTVTRFMFRQNPRAGLEVPLLGFGGEFVIKQGPNEVVSFVAGGVGITPLLGQAPNLDLGNLMVFWTVKIEDLQFVNDTFRRIPALAASTRLFVSGKSHHELLAKSDAQTFGRFKASCASVQSRRLVSTDLQDDRNMLASSRFYICTGPGLRKDLLEWLVGKEVIYENFNY